MPTDAVIASTVNFEELRQALADAPEETARFVKTPLFRFARRVARRIKRESLSGRPGIEGGPWKRLRDRNVQGFTVGNGLAGLKAVNKVSRILRAHVEGATITPKGGEFLFLSRKTGQAGAGRIFARARSVTIPARVKVIEPWQQEVQKTRTQVVEAMERAMKMVLDRRMKAVSGLITRAVS